MSYFPVGVYISSEEEKDQSPNIFCHFSPSALIEQPCRKNYSSDILIT